MYQYLSFVIQNYVSDQVLTKILMFSEMEECRADKSWAYFFKEIKNCSYLSNNVINTKSCSPNPILLQENHY